MRKTTGKILSLLLTAAMLLSMLPTMAMAAETPDTTEREEVLLESEQSADHQSRGAMPKAAGDTMYVSGTGKDDTGDGSVATPFATISKAYTGVTDGGAIRVLTDLTSAATTILGGTKAVTLTGWDATDAGVAAVRTISRGDSIADAILDATGTSAITVTNLTFDGKNAAAKSPLIRVGGATTTNINNSGVMLLGDKVTMMPMMANCWAAASL